jgi:hypothetical protein
VSDVKVMPEHRLHAILDVYSADESDLGTDTRRWIATGMPVDSQRVPGRVAHRCAEHEHRARTSVIADVVAELRGLVNRAYKGDYVNRTLVVDADSIELLIETLEAQS